MASHFVFQFGNTCYSNSVLQALYFCKPFREKVLEYKAKNKRSKETLFGACSNSVREKDSQTELKNNKTRDAGYLVIWKLIRSVCLTTDNMLRLKI